MQLGYETGLRYQRNKHTAKRFASAPGARERHGLGPDGHVPSGSPVRRRMAAFRRI